MKQVFILLFLFAVLSCTKTNEKKQQIIRENLEKTNEHVKNGSWYSKKHGDLVIPDILKKDVESII